MENDFKLDSQLKVALNIQNSVLDKSNLNVGYDKNSNLWEVIVKYNGTFEKIKQDLDIKVEILSTSYAIVTLSREDIYKLVLYREIEYIEQPRVLTFTLDTATTSSCINQVKSSPYNLTGKGTIVAIIDSGINYLHKDFRNADGTTRILYIWDQTIEGNAPEGFLGGTLYTREDINKALNTINPLEVVPSQDEIGHGTAVAGIACGNGSSSNGRYRGVASESEIIVVKLGERGRESFARNTEIMRAIKFIIDRAIELNMPVSINISFGTNDGSHTGGSLFETYIDDMSNIWKTAICVATGNEGSSSHHYEDMARVGEEITVEVEVSSELSSLYIVLFKNFSDLFDIKVIAPNGTETEFINNSSRKGVYNLGNSSLYINLGEPVPYTLEQGVFFEIIANQTRLDAGIWRIVILGRNIVQGRFDIWLPVTEASSRNTKFLKPSVSTTLTIPSTATNVISVGGYNDLTNSIADFSGRGFTRNNQIKPDIVAPATNITTTSNFLGYNTLSGTSFATPFVTGSCALLMEWGIVNLNDLFLYGERLKAFLRLGAKRNKNLVYPNGEWGFGSLCVLETLRFLELYKGPISITNTENLVRKMEAGNISNENEENIFYSEDYIAILAQFNLETINAIEQNDFIKMCRVVSGGFVVLYIKKEELDLFAQKSYRMVLQVPFALGLMNKSALEASGILAVQNQPILNHKGTDVLIGIVDTGINYTIDEFKYEDNTTKIVSIWDQTIPGNPPEKQCFGTEYTREMINEALASENPLEVVPSQDEIGHGTQIASICAGRENIQKDFIGVAPESELIIVKLRQAKNNLKDFYYIDQNKIAYDSSDLILGIEYLYEKADELNKPIAIYLGLGTNSGTHNGFSILEQFLSNISIINGVGLCVCNGNEGNTQHHALLKLTEVEEEETFEIKVGENERGFMVNIVAFPSDRIGVNIISPEGRSSGRIPPRNNYDEEIFFPFSNTRVRVQHFFNYYQTSGQLILLTFKSPSPGIWKVNVYGENILIGDIHAWLPISNFISNETYFLNSDPFYTVTLPATANTVVATGGYNSANNSFYVASGRGPTRLNYSKPIICAPSVNVSCIGNTGQLEIISGTSAGTAITTGCAALLLEWGIVRGNSPIMNSTTIIGNLASGAKRVPNEMLPNNRWGFGILDLLGTFEKL